MAWAAFDLLGVTHAEANEIKISVTPQYTACLSGTQCSSGGSISFAAKYRIFRNKHRELRIKLGREYQGSNEESNEDINLASLRPNQFPSGTADLRLRTYDDLSYIRYTWRTGAVLQRSAGAQGFSHTYFLSYDPYFGRRIPRGSDGPAHQFDVRVKLSETLYQVGLPQTIAALTPAVFFPFNSHGTSRLQVGYTAQHKVGGPGGTSPYSGRFFSEYTRDFTASFKASLRLENTSLSGPNSTSLIALVEYTF